VNNTNSRVRDIFEHALVILSDEGRFCRGAIARNARFQVVAPGHLSAVSWSLDGAIDKASRSLPLPLTQQLDYARACKRLLEARHGPLWRFSDSATHTEILSSLSAVVALI
jgi:hypothetical protein